MSQGAVAIVGAGRLGGAVVRGLMRAGLGREHIHILQRPGPTSEAWQAQGFPVSTGFQGAAPPTAVLVAVKPPALPDTVERLLASGLSAVPVVSLASGMTLQAWRAALGPRFPVFRARANVLVATGRGNILLAGSPAPAAAEQQVLGVLGLLGSVFRVSEEEMVAQTWYSSSLPLVLVSRLVVDSLEGSPTPSQRGLAEQLVFQALVGMAEQLSEAAHEAKARGAPFSLTAELRGLLERVATPGGMNAAALQVLERGGFTQLVEAARLTYQSTEPRGGPGGSP